jgi:hypothetical protein
MITNTEAEELKILLKKDYVGDVLKVLNTKGITNRAGVAYSEVMIRNVLNGYAENKAIEETLFEVFEQRKKALKKTQQRRNKILAK